METRIFLTIAILAFNLNFSYSNNVTEMSVDRPVTHELVNLAPAVPGVADFSDLIPESAPSAASLIPVTPKEAGFDDEFTGETSINLLNALSPSTPKEADFEDNDAPDYNVFSLTPTPPDEAGFDETI